MSEPPSKKIKLVVDIEASKEGHLDTELEDDDNGFGLNSSDLEDLLDDADYETETKNSTSRDLTDPLIKAYIERYPKILKQEDIETCIKFIQLLETAKIDSFSCYDLEIENIVGDPNYIINSCNTLDELTRRNLWDEYCKHSVGDVNTNLIFDTPELEFVKFIKDFAKNNKIPKFYTDFNRVATRIEKQSAIPVYSDLCKVVDKSTRLEIFNHVKELVKLSGPSKIDYCLKIVRRLQVEVKTWAELSDIVKNKKVFDGYVIFMLEDDERKNLVENLKCSVREVKKYK